MGDESTFQPFDRTGLLRRAAPFLGAMWLALVIYPLPPHGGDSDMFVPAVALNVIIVLAVLIVPWRRLGPMAAVVPPLAYLLVIALLRQADGGGSSSYGALLMLPIFWLALYGSPQQLAIGFAGLAAVFVVPVFLIGAPDYPSSEWARGLVWLCVAPIIGFTVQSLVREQRKRAEENLRRADELQVSQEETRKLVVSMAAVTEATRELARTTDPQVARGIICAAACTVTGARFAKLMERSPDGELVMTANHGLESGPPLTVPLGDEASGAGSVFLSKKPLFVQDARGDDRISQRVVMATSAVSMHFEPVLRNEEAVAVLVVGWRTRSTARAGSPRRCGCSPPRPRWRSSAPTCWRGSRRSRAPMT